MDLSDEQVEQNLWSLLHSKGKTMLPYEYTQDTPIRREMRPSEVDALMAQGQQGLQPELAPTSLWDLLMNPVNDLLGEADLSKYLMPAALLGMVRYKRPGVSAAAREAAEAYHATPRIDPINAKASVFHATDPQYVEDILKAGEIVPDPQRLSERGFQSWDQFARLKNLDKDAPVSQEILDRAIAIAKKTGADQATLDRAVYYTNPTQAGHNFGQFLRYIFPGDEEKAQTLLAHLGYKGPYNQHIEGLSGVSVSRVPRVASKDTKAVSFVIDPEKMPPSRPFAEPSYQKTILSDKPAWPGRMNPHFEFEDRTYGTAIPASAVRELWVDRSAIPNLDIDLSKVYYPEMMAGKQREAEQRLQSLRDLAGQAGIGWREFKSGREMHSGRARPK